MKIYLYKEEILLKTHLKPLPWHTLKMLAVQGVSRVYGTVTRLQSALNTRHGFISFL